MKTFIIAVAALMALAALYSFLPRGVMPMDPVTLEKFQEANSRITRELMERAPDQSYHLRTSTALRRAIRSLGYHPEQTLLHWSTPEFRAEMHARYPGEAIGMLRLTGRLLAEAFADGAGEAEFLAIVSAFPEDLRRAAMDRRGLDHE